MNRKAINLIISKKIKEWVESIEDEELRQRCHREVIVTGGSIVSMLLDEEVNDFDLYFKTKATTWDVAQYYLRKFQQGRTAQQGGIPYEMSLEELKDTLGRDRIRLVVRSAGVAGDEQKQDYQYFETQDSEGAGDYVEEAMGNVDEEARPTKPMYHPVFLSSNAITLKGKIQIVIRFFGGPEAIHENFDFVHCMNYWTKNEGVVLNAESLEAILTRTLIYRGSLYPVCSVFRAKKFIQRGWSINAGQYLKMCLQISKLDLTNFQVLEEQLTGVDVAYFQEVLSKARDRENPDRVETAYLMEIINRMF